MPAAAPREQPMFFLTSTRRPPSPACSPAPRSRQPGREPGGAGRYAPSAFGAAAVALGAAVQVNYGQYHPVAGCWLTVALIATVVGCRWMCCAAAAGPGPD